MKRDIALSNVSFFASLFQDELIKKILVSDKLLIQTSENRFI